MAIGNNLDAAFCGKVPLHQTNLIQPHGVLLIVDKSDYTILQASENITEIFGSPATVLVRTSFLQLIGDDAEKLKAVFKSNLSGKLPFVFTYGEKRFLSTIEQQDAYYILEIEMGQSAVERTFGSVYQDVKYVMAAIDACATTEEVCQAAVKGLKALSGFDKIMIYRFDEAWNGDVVAEEMEEGMESYIGLKFPASDIPKQARELYKKSPYRLIPNIDYEPVRLFPVLNPLTNAFTNLANSNLRSVAHVHLEYLRNMNVVASMSTRILKDGELWGLIACHHRTPNYVSFEMCSVFELLSNVIAAKISSLQNQDSFQFKAGKLDVQRKIVENVLQQKNLAFEKEKLLQLLDADGIAVVANYQIDTIGLTPDREQIEDLVYWLQANRIHGLYIQLSLPSVYEAALAYAKKGSGLLALPIALETGSFILAFRQEAMQKISWGGNPSEAVQFESDGKKYHPRASFKIWQQTVHQTALPWRMETLEVAESFRHFLIESTLNKKY